MSKAFASHEGTCNGVKRRDLVRVGGLTALGLGMGDYLRHQRLWGAEGKAATKAKSCILIWLDGGPSHLETFDPKPEAPLEVRGPLGTIPTTIPGIRFSECLPKTAAAMNQIAIVRSMTSPLGEHNFGTHYLMTGYKPTPVLEYPAYGAVVSQLHRGSGVLPSNIAVPSFNVGGSQLTGSGYLPAATRPFSVGGDPSKADFAVRDLDFFQGLDLTRLDRRRQFVAALNAFEEGKAKDQNHSSDPDLERAYQLIASEDAKRAFLLREEPAAVRKQYGGKTIGQSCLLARRLVERGVPFVTVNDRGWDTHEKLQVRLKDGFAGAKVDVGLVPTLDHALSALISDLDQRAMLDETLVVVMGEFGRTPKLNTRGGRDHWPRVFSVLMAGGGVAGGQVIGSSDAVGESPLDRPVTPSDLAATIYTLLGIDPKKEFQTDDGRPVRISPYEAEPVSELIA
ncbi:MAG: DUF1501 domain-containing protein [Planctomycetaceae bacterium]|jgi:hypothetical protein|nr:DUF1501 domain-containing protein [Planctomycetaceae bacterium]